jgi:hypothetical protein
MDGQFVTPNTLDAALLKPGPGRAGQLLRRPWGAMIAAYRETALKCVPAQWWLVIMEKPEMPMLQIIAAALIALTLTGCMAPVMLRDPVSGQVTQCLLEGAFPIINQQQCVAAHENMGWVRTTAAEAQQRRTAVWYKPNQTQLEFARDKYACMMDGREQVSNSSIRGGAAFGNTYLPATGSSSSGQIISQDLVSACLEARGYTQ